MPPSALNTNLTIMEGSLINFPRKQYLDGSLGWESALLPFDYTYSMLKPHNCINATTVLGVTLGPLVIPEKQGGWRRESRTWNFQRYWRKIMWKILGSSSKKRNFQGWSRKIRFEFPWVLVSQLKISKGGNTVLWNFQAWRLVFFRDFQRWSNKPKNRRVFFQKVMFSTLSPVWIFLE